MLDEDKDFQVCLVLDFRKLVMTSRENNRLVKEPSSRLKVTATVT